MLPGENWDPKRRSPLTEVGVNVSAGDWIVAVNGRPTSDVRNVNELLVNAAERFLKKIDLAPASELSRADHAVRDQQRSFFKAARE